MACKNLHEFFGGVTQFGRLRLIAEDLHGRRGNQRYAWCKCVCGTVKSINIYSLRKGVSQSCGCLRAEVTEDRTVVHGHARPAQQTPEYRAWADAKSRCFNPNVRNFAEYGGRGITMCPEWQESFEAFYQDMGPRPSPIHSLDRRDTNGHYEPVNCRWSTDKEQCRNTRFNRVLEVDGERMTMIEAAERYSIKRATIWQRLNMGWSVDDAVKKPVRKSSRWH